MNIMKNNEIKISSNKSFGIVFAIVFFLIALWPIIKSDDIRIWSLIVSIIFLILGIMNSSILTLPVLIFSNGPIKQNKSPFLMFLYLFNCLKGKGTPIIPLSIVFVLFLKELLLE